MLIDTQVNAPAPGLPAIGLHVESLAKCQRATSHGGVVPADILPKGWSAASGLIAFSLLDCDSPGFKADIALTLPTPLPAGSKLMKISRGTDGKTRVSEIATATITGNVVRYSVTDGGELDEDGQVNASMVDPVVLARPASVDPTVPDVQSVPVNNPLVLSLAALLMAVCAAAIPNRRRRR
ncbi:choice-of-anchor U domain-containing protein [Diaphorobacter aerolatus]|uniref:IPTL-CTERM sorting domain-containing protein n=1 Tax=Diaphorobacter aerolatus TaxID=1288495 RepID=A0A7H0GHV1_9BURK|nr:choice-of-anchor U domain-containing protein [Diaphorobacter aerolatus]QNP47867.1 hypothetical protein H9K75_17230 [Diaphorobacter aerolatus]